MDKTEKLLERIAKTLDHQVQVTTGGALSREEAARYLGISPRTLHELCVGGKIKRVVVSPARFVFRREELDRYLVDNEEVVTDEIQAKADRLFDEAHAS